MWDFSWDAVGGKGLILQYREPRDFSRVAAGFSNYHSRIRRRSRRNKSSTWGGEAQVRRDPQRIHAEEQCPRQAESGPMHLPLMRSLEDPSKGRSLPTTITLPPWVTAGGGHVAKQTWLLPWLSKDPCD